MGVTLCEDPTVFRAADWTDLVLADPNGTFFQTPAYLKLWWEEFGDGRLVLALATGDEGEPAGACSFHVQDGVLTFLGGFEVTDYMGPVGAPGAEKRVAREMIAALVEGVEWRRADLRGLPVDSPWLEALEVAAADQGLAVERGENGAAPVIDLPETWDEYLAGLPAKLRHEIRRKERRLREEFGGYRVEFATRRTLPALYDRFIELHKQSPGPKGKFMHAGMEIFFRRLGDSFIDDHIFHLGFIEIGGAPAAGFIGFGYKERFLLYNSAFDRGYAKWSPGMVLISWMIRDAIEGEGRGVFDLLKGDLEYKRRFGPRVRPIGRLSIERP